jgi:GDP/UDP-N,N'-diacetylbacillosamine 2-epimerase (hydrolysing)
LIFTGPGADAENIAIKRIIKKFIDKADNAYYFNSLGQKNYLSILKLVDCMIGNSSSGLSEMPTFRKASINLGIRQKGRIKSQSVIDSKIKTIDIIKSIKKVYSEKFVEILKASKNPYGSPGASKKIVNIIKKQNFKNILEKKFYDVKLGNYK